MKRIAEAKNLSRNYNVYPKKGIIGRPDRFIQFVFNGNLRDPFDRIINAKSKKDITHKHEVRHG